jgi:hypothetical protein
MYKYTSIICVILGISCSQHTLYFDKGTFDLDVKIGNRNYKDILELQEVAGQKRKGLFTVPDIFKVEFSGMVKDDELIGDFLAKENGGTFKVDLKAKLVSKCKVKGELLTGGKRFAEFEGKERGCYE